MLVSTAVVVVSVALGAVLALAPARGSRVLGFVRVFALTASLAVVVLRLLPEALSLLGGWALLLFAGGLALPAWVNRLVSRLAERGEPLHAARSEHAACLEAGYVGLLAHRVGDGMALAAVETCGSGAMAQTVVFLALAAHTVPVVAVVTLAFDAVRGRRVALLRASWLAVAGAVGVLSAAVVPFESVEHADGCVAAVVGGLLVHVVMHDLRVAVPERATGLGAKLAAALVGVSLAVLAALVR